MENMASVAAEQTTENRGQLPDRAEALGRRALQLEARARGYNRRHMLEIFFTEDGWYLIVDNGKMEKLGE